MFYEGFRQFNRAHPLRQDPKRISPEAFDSLQEILNRWDTTEEYTDTRWLAYMLSTVFWETGGSIFPVREGLCKDQACSLAYLEELWANRLVRTRYWDPDITTGESYYGRGQVQLTHLVNYWRVGFQLARTHLGDDQFDDLDRRLVEAPDMALLEWVSTAALMEGMVRGWYNKEYGKGLGTYINKDVRDDRAGYLEARRTVNGKDQRQMLADFALEIHKFIKSVRASQDHSAPDLADLDPLEPIDTVPMVTDGSVRPINVDDVDIKHAVGPTSEDDVTTIERFRDVPVDLTRPVGPTSNVEGRVPEGIDDGLTKCQRRRNERRRRRLERQRQKAASRR